jgi:hypothetical protein
MITELSAAQLAVLLDIKPKDARNKMIFVYCKQHKKDPTGFSADRDTPSHLPISLLSEKLNLPNLQEMVNDVHENFFKRPATRHWILNYPGEKLSKLKEKGKEFPKTIQIPTSIKRLIKPEVHIEIVKAWEEHYSSTEYKGRFV